MFLGNPLSMKVKRRKELTLFGISLEAAFELYGMNSHIRPWALLLFMSYKKVCLHIQFSGSVSRMYWLKYPFGSCTRYTDTLDLLN